MTDSLLQQPDKTLQPNTAGGTSQSGTSKRRRRLTLLAVLGATALATTACSSAKSSSPPSQTTPSSVSTTTRNAHGTLAPTGVVTSVSPTALSIHAGSKTSTVAISSATKYKENSANVTLSAVKKGERVRIRLETTSATPTAATVLILAPSVTGTITAVDPTGFNLSTPKGTTETVTTSTTTTYRSGSHVASASSLHDGDRVRVTGQAVTPSASITALTVTILTPKAP